MKMQMARDPKLNGKVALITGGTSGIGKACAELFASEGASVALVGHSDITKANSVAENITKTGGLATPYLCDLSDISKIHKLVDIVTNDHSRIDILINSAGLFYQTDIGDTTESQYDKIMDINLKSLFFCCNEVAPIMKKQGNGNIINISSVAGVMALGGFSIYCASKAGVNLITRALSQELAPYGISVNAILPGNTATPMNENIRTEKKFEPLLNIMTNRTPSGRTYSDSMDMARAALFMASDDSRAMHGSLLVLDEGLSLGM